MLFLRYKQRPKGMCMEEDQVTLYVYERGTEERREGRKGGKMEGGREKEKI